MRASAGACAGRAWPGRGPPRPGASPAGDRGRLPPSTGVVAAASAPVGLVVAAVHAFWAFGGTAGLDAEYSAETGVVSAAHGLCALAAAAGSLLLARGGAFRAIWPLALAWTGAGATLTWGAWMLIASAGPQLDGGERPAAALLLTYAGQMITGLLAAAVLVRYLGSRRPA